MRISTACVSTKFIKNNKNADCGEKDKEGQCFHGTSFMPDEALNKGPLRITEEDHPNERTQIPSMAISHQGCSERIVESSKTVLY